MAIKHIGVLSWGCGHFDGLVQERRNSSALAMELRLSWYTQQFLPWLMAIQHIGTSIEFRAWIGNYMFITLCNMIIHPCFHFIEVRTLMSNYTQRKIMEYNYLSNYLSKPRSQIKYVSKKVPEKHRNLFIPNVHEINMFWIRSILCFVPSVIIALNNSMLWNSILTLVFYINSDLGYL